MQPKLHSKEKIYIDKIKLVHDGRHIFYVKMLQMINCNVFEINAFVVKYSTFCLNHIV